MTTTPTLWLQQFTTNLLTADPQANPKVVGLANGNFLVAWEDDNPNAAPGSFQTDMAGVIFDALGNPLTDSLFLNFPFGFSQDERELEIAARPDGGFAIVYVFPNSGATDIIFGIYDDMGNRFPSSGSQVGAGFVVNDTSADSFDYNSPTIAVGDDGSLFVTYIKDDGTNQNLMGKKISADGNTIGAEQLLREDGFVGAVADSEDMADPLTVTLSNGDFATVYLENDDFSGGTERTVEVRISNADGTNSTLINNVSAPDGEPDSSPSIAALNDGRFVVVWLEDGDLRGSIYNNNGTLVSGDFAITQNSSLIFSDPQVIGLEDGSYFVTFGDETGDRLFGLRQNNGSQIGFTFFIDPALADATITDYDVSLTTDGRILISWDNNGDIFTEILDPRDVGSITADADDGQTTDRQGLSNTIIGSSEDDHIYGLDGNDLINGNAGNDTLDGGTGEDDMFGGLDDDTYHFDDLSDTATELVGEGTDKVFTSVKINTALAGFENIEVFELIGTENTLLGNNFDTTLIANADLGSKIFANGGEDLLLGSAFNDRLDGGDGDDILFGEDGRDRLDGGRDADEMFGGGGDDRYFVDDLGDTVTELAGEGTDQVRSSVDWTLGDDVEDLRLRGTADMGIGNDLANVIQTVAAGSFLSGFGGDDNLRGSNGMDTILGGNDNDTINGRAGDDDLRGGKGDDFIKGRAGEDHLQGGSGDDELIGGKDNDLIEGGAQQDTLKGEAGADTFKWSDGDFAGLDALTADRILDFSQSDGDVIDFADVDAIAGGADDDFVYLGNAAFTGTAGELRWENDSGDTMVYMDIDGDGMAEYAVALDGTLSLTAADFIL